MSGQMVRPISAVVFAILVLATASGGCAPGGGPMGQGSGGACSGNGSGDVLFLLNSSVLNVTVLIGYPDGSSCSQVLDTSSFGAVTSTETSYILDEVYTFVASSSVPGIADSDPASCIVNQVVLDNGAANVQAFVPTLSSQLVIECTGNWDR